MIDSAQSQGEFFSRLYIERGPPTRDSVTFRYRLIGYLENHHHADFNVIAAAAKQNLGLVVPAMRGIAATYYDIPTFLKSEPMPHILGMITLIWRVFKPRFNEKAWRDFVSHAMREENLGYTIDESGGIHYLVDQEFERNRVSALRAADGPKYAAVRAAFESAHSYLDAQPQHTKACVRSVFEAVEILARLMDPESSRLNRALVVGKIRTIALSTVSDAVEKEGLGKIFEGLADWVDAMHLYRHGQATQEPVAPSIEFAVYALSSGAAALRLLLGVDRAVHVA